MAVVLIALIAVPMGGCGTLGKLGGMFGNILTPNRNNDFAEAHIRFDAGAIRYDKFHSKIIDDTNERRVGVVTNLQWNELDGLEKNVIAAKDALVSGFETWETSGTKPADFKAKEKTLDDAREKYIALVEKVLP